MREVCVYPSEGKTLVTQLGSGPEKSQLSRPGMLVGQRSQDRDILGFNIGKLVISEWSFGAELKQREFTSRVALRPASCCPSL